MDKTITRRPTLTQFLIHAARLRAPWRLVLLPIAGLAGLAFKLGLIDRGRVKEIALRLMLGPFLPADSAASLAVSFADRLCATGLFDDALARIAADRTSGCRLVMATASCSFYVRAIADRLNFDDVVATDLIERADGALLARIAGENCYGAGKRRLVGAWLTDQGLDAGSTPIRFYSDHVSDAACFEMASEAFAINPHPPLRELAKKRGWAILSWR